MKKFLIILLFILVIFGGAAFFGYSYYNGIGAEPLKSDEETITVAVESNDSLNRILDRLATEGRLRSLIVTKLYLRYNPLDTNIKKGTYLVRTDSSLEEMVRELREGKDINLVNVTIPEGYTITKMGEVFEKAGLFTKDRFIAAAEAFPVPDWVLDTEFRRYAMEGFLMPDTYGFEKGSTPEYAVERLYQAFVTRMEKLISDAGIDLPTSRWNRVITIAAMIEREAANAAEMPRVASVILNRLDIPMRLQIDATVVYALGKDSTDRVLLSDLEVDSPYNTYRVSGLPIGPIANPGVNAIKAALNPEQTDYIYYVLNPAAREHFFTNDYNEFLAKKKEFAQ